MPATRTPVAPSPLALLKMQRAVRRVVCSSPWFDACWHALIAGRLRATQRVDVALDKAAIFPPGGTRSRHPTAMRRCRACGSTWYPPQYVVTSSRLCLDCLAARSAPYTDERTHVPSTSSPSAAAIQAIAHRKQRLIELPLAAEDEASLRREIAQGKSASLTPS